MINSITNLHFNENEINTMNCVYFEFTDEEILKSIRKKEVIVFLMLLWWFYHHKIYLPTYLKAPHFL